MATAPLHEDYTVRLDHFQGPLDLLLYLIRRAEVDIHDIPIHEVTEQYFAFLRQIQHVDIDLAGEFLVMAATLIEIKSRTLAPVDRGARGEGEDARAASHDEPIDPRHELVQQLLAYQRYRRAAEELDERRTAFLQRYGAAVRRDPDTRPADDDAGIELDDAHLMDLFDAYERIVGSIDFTRLGEHRVEYDDTPIALHQEDLFDQLRRAPESKMSLRAIFQGRSRLEAIGLFLAMLELARQRLVVIEQPDVDGEIEIAVNDEPASEGVPVFAAESHSASGGPDDDEDDEYDDDDDDDGFDDDDDDIDDDDDDDDDIDDLDEIIGDDEMTR